MSGFSATDDELGGWYSLLPSAPELAASRARQASMAVVFPDEQREPVDVRTRVPLVDVEELRAVDELAEALGAELAGDSVERVVEELTARTVERSRRHTSSERSLAYRARIPEETTATESAPVFLPTPELEEIL